MKINAEILIFVCYVPVLCTRNDFQFSEYLIAKNIIITANKAHAIDNQSVLIQALLAFSITTFSAKLISDSVNIEQIESKFQ